MTRKEMNPLINNNYDGSGGRLFRIRKALGMTQIEFAKIINSSNGHVSDMEKDRKNITESTIELLKLKCNVNEEWLRTGAGGDDNMFIKTSDLSLDEFAKLHNASESDYQLIRNYLSLNPDIRSQIQSLFSSKG